MIVRQGTSISSDTSPLVSRPAKIPNTLSLWLAAGLLVGTGGIANIDTLKAISQTGTTLIVRFGSHRPIRSLLLLPQEKLAGIRRYLSLNISEIAKVLRVRRPTVYAWLKGSSEPRSGHLDRIDQIYNVAKEWRYMSTLPLAGMLSMRFTDDTTLLDLLSEEAIDEMSIAKALAVVHEAVTRRPVRRSVAEAAKARGLRLRTRNPKWSSDEQFNM